MSEMMIVSGTVPPQRSYSSCAAFFTCTPTLPLAQSTPLAYRQLEFRVFHRRAAIDARSHLQMACRTFGRLFVDVSRAREVNNQSNELECRGNIEACRCNRRFTFQKAAAARARF